MTKIKIKVLHLTTFLQGGAGRVILNLCQKSLSNNVEPTVLTSEKDKDEYFNFKEYIDKMNSLGIKLYLFRSFFLRDKVSIRKSVNYLGNFLRKNKFDVVHTHTAHCSKICLIAMEEMGIKIPVIQTIHGWGTLKSIKQEETDIDTINKINKIIYISKSLKRQLLVKGVCNKSSKIIYNGIYGLNDKTYSLSNSVKIKNSESIKIIGCIGSFDQFKNQKLIIDTIAQFRKLKKYKFVFIGEGPYQKEAQTFCDKNDLNNCVSFWGYKKEAFKFISSFDLIIHPSISEGGPPLAILESFICKTLVIASNIEPHKEIVEDNKTGFLFKNRNHYSLCNAIHRAIDSKNVNFIIREAASRCRDKFDFSVTFKSYLDEYINLTK